MNSSITIPIGDALTSAGQGEPRTMDDITVSFQEARKILGLSAHKLRRLVTERRVPGGATMVGRAWRFSRAALLAHAQQTIHPSPFAAEAPADLATLEGLDPLIEASLPEGLDVSTTSPSAEAPLAAAERRIVDLEREITAAAEVIASLQSSVQLLTRRCETLASASDVTRARHDERAQVERDHRHLLEFADSRLRAQSVLLTQITNENRRLQGELLRAVLLCPAKSPEQDHPDAPSPAPAPGEATAPAGSRTRTEPTERSRIDTPANHPPHAASTGGASTAGEVIAASTPATSEPPKAPTPPFASAQAAPSIAAGAAPSTSKPPKTPKLPSPATKEQIVEAGIHLAADLAVAAWRLWSDTHRTPDPLGR